VVTLLVCFLLTAILIINFSKLFSSGFKQLDREKQYLSWILITLLISIAFIIKGGGGLNLWIVSLYYVPFFSSIRVLSRYMEIISLIVPFIFAIYFSEWNKKMKGPLKYVIVGLIIPVIMLDQVDISYGTFQQNETFISQNAYGEIKAKCNSFYYLPISSLTSSPPLWVYPVDALSIAIGTGVPTINGASSFKPPNYPEELSSPSGIASVINSLSSWKRLNRLERVCLLQTDFRKSLSTGRYPFTLSYIK